MNAVAPNTATSTALRADRLNTFYGQSHVLRDVDFHIGREETVSLLGRNGMGKTTLLRTLMGLVPPRSGRVTLNGCDVTGARPSMVARLGMALVPEGRGIFPNLTVEENLTFAARPGRGARPPWTLERVYALFQRLVERRSHWGNELSGGEQKMLAIGRALMTNPDILLLDETTEGLAPIVREEIWTTVRLVAASGIATVLVDKNLEELLALADRHVVLSKGAVVFDGSTARLREGEALIHRHLGV